MQSIFAIYVVEDIANAPFSWYDDGFFIKLKIIFSFYGLRPHKERICSIFLCLITITASCPNLCDISNLDIIYSIRTVFLYQFFQLTHNSVLIGVPQ